jgi:hypothetical protein
MGYVYVAVYVCGSMIIYVYVAVWLSNACVDGYVRYVSNLMGGWNDVIHIYPYIYLSINLAAMIRRRCWWRCL